VSNLGPPDNNPASRRPFQKGKARGVKNGASVEVEKEWMVDSGAECSAITIENAARFDLTALGGTATSPAAGGPMTAASGLTMVFSLEQADGTSREVTCNYNILVGLRLDILGNDQLGGANVEVDWDPSTRVGVLRQIQPPAGGGGTPAGGNLGGTSSNPVSRKPYQAGKVRGVRNGTAVELAKEWMVDTGAEYSVISKSNADQLDLTPTGATSGVFVIKTGLKMVFTVKNAQGVDEEVECDLPVLVAPDDTYGDILGMDQIAHVGARVRWRPGDRSGDIYRPAGAGPGGSSGGTSGGSSGGGTGGSNNGGWL
jgi:hypothetical protein